MPAPTLVTDRLVLRQWRDDDLDPWADLNTDPDVMEFIGPLLSRDAAAMWLGWNRAFLHLRPYGLWAVEVKGGPPFVGFVGLNEPRWDAAFTPCVEVGWRLARHAWGHGYATEAARAALQHGFDTVGLDEIVSFTTRANARSQAVMRRLGMSSRPADDFEHPMLTPDEPLRPHVLFRLSRSTWTAG